MAFPTVVAPDTSAFDWGTSLAYDFAVGSLSELPSYATSSSGQNAGPATGFDSSGDAPLPGQGYWYLFRKPGALSGESGFCNGASISWGNPQRDAALP